MHGSGRIDAVLFDLDDTLIDWWGSTRRCLEQFAADDVIEALLQHCRERCWEQDPLGTHTWHRNNWKLHTYREELWPAALPFLDDAERELLMKRFADELWVGFFPDTVPALDVLVDRIRLGVLSNNFLLDDEVARLRLHDWFEVAVHPAYELRKPNREAFELGAAALGLPLDRCLYVGDSIKADALGAHAAGMSAVWLDRWADGWATRPAEVHRITSLAELPALLATLAA